MTDIDIDRGGVMERSHNPNDERIEQALADAEDEIGRLRESVALFAGIANVVTAERDAARAAPARLTDPDDALVEAVARSLADADAGDWADSSYYMQDARAAIAALARHLGVTG